MWKMNVCSCHIRGQKTTATSWDVHVFHHLVSMGEWRNSVLFFLFCFFLVPNKIAETSRHYPAKSRPNICDVYWGIDFPWQLLADGVQRMGPCMGPRVLGEIQAALCTPREWGLAYIECLCCRIESVEHLCLSSLTVKLGLTKNPSYTNRKWSRAFFPPPHLFPGNRVFLRYVFSSSYRKVRFTLHVVYDRHEKEVEYSW